MSSEPGVENVLRDRDLTEDVAVPGSAPQDGSSDGEGGERTAREKLKKTSLAGLTQRNAGTHAAAGDQTLTDSATLDGAPEPPNAGSLRGRPSKKRSFEDLQTEDSVSGVEHGGPPVPKKGLHKRMRSREITQGDAIHGLDTLDDLASPVQEESDTEAQQSPGGPGVLVAAPSSAVVGESAKTPDASTIVPSEPNDTHPAAEQRPTVSDLKNSAPPADVDASKSHAPVPAAFSNTSAASPFGSFKSPKSPGKESPEKATSASAFASSGLSAFASSEKSPFGVAGTTAKASSGFAAVKPAGFGSTGFGSASGGFGGASPFTTSKPLSGFGASSGLGSSTGAIGGAFGSAPKPFGTGSSFLASAGGPGTFGKGKPFGKTSEEADEGSEDDGEDEAPQSSEDVDRDPRFHQQDVETGEEEEETIFSCRAKLYHFEKEWKESGVGVLKINVRYETKQVDINSSSDEVGNEENKSDEDVEAGEPSDFPGLVRKARLILRADGTHRLVLNTPVFKEMNVGTHDGEEPSGRTMHLTALEEGKPTGFQMKVGKEELLKEVYHKIRELQEEL